LALIFASTMPVSMKRKESGIARATMKRRPPVAQEGEQDHRNENRALKEVFLDGVNGRVDQIRAVIDDADLPMPCGSFS
jgi:hypothetical protein